MWLCFKGVAMTNTNIAASTGETNSSCLMNKNKGWPRSALKICFAVGKEKAFWKKESGLCCNYGTSRFSAVRQICWSGGKKSIKSRKSAENGAKALIFSWFLVWMFIRDLINIPEAYNHIQFQTHIFQLSSFAVQCTCKGGFCIMKVKEVKHKVILDDF